MQITNHFNEEQLLMTTLLTRSVRKFPGQPRYICISILLNVSGTAKTGLLEVNDVASKTSLKLTSCFASAIKFQLQNNDFNLLFYVNEL